jgi:AcrR family transcriptional regulator
MASFRPLDIYVNGVNMWRMAPADTRARLIASARELIVGEGIEGLSMRRVASQCGVSATAIYRHFADKDALACAAVVDGFRLFGSYLAQSLQAPTPLERLERIGRRYFDFAREHPHEYRLIFMLDCPALGLEKLDESSRREIDGTFQMLQDRIAECQLAGVVRAGDPRSLAAFVWASSHGLASLMISGNLDAGPEPALGLVEQQLSLTLKAILR